MKKTLYFMRHGKTLFNVLHLKQGWSDSPLTDLGKAQARIAKRYFQHAKISFDHCYASTSERASDTLEIITDEAYTRVRGLKEWNFGRLEGSNDVVDPKPPYGDFFVQYGGEAEVDFRQRLLSTITEIMEQDDHKSVLMVSHGAACAQMIRAHASRSNIRWKGLVSNCAVLKFSYEDHSFILEEIIEHDFSELDL